MLNKMITVLLVIVLGLALIPIINSFVNFLIRPELIDPVTSEVSQTAGVFHNSTNGTLIGILPILFIILVVVGTITFIRIRT